MSGREERARRWAASFVVRSMAEVEKKAPRLASLDESVSAAGRMMLEAECCAVGGHSHTLSDGEKMRNR
jgi:hypothetical protein